MNSMETHPDYNYEVNRLKEVKQYINQFIETLKEKQKASKEQIKDAFVNLDHLDSSQSYITILVNARHIELEKLPLAEDTNVSTSILVLGLCNKPLLLMNVLAG